MADEEKFTALQKEYAALSEKEKAEAKRQMAEVDRVCSAADDELRKKVNQMGNQEYEAWAREQCRRK
jgi:hypothetical protein